jgi:hypothetical protein
MYLHTEFRGLPERIQIRALHAGGVDIVAFSKQLLKDL